MPLWRHFEQGGKRGYAVWHRRSGKDDVALHLASVSAHQRVGNYWHMLPEASQARKAIWEAVNPHTGKRRIDEAFPHELRDSTREAEMAIRFRCGSTWQVVGSDNYNSLVGATPVGIVFSEWALADPQAWAYLRPILAENGGWALFITTPRGRNHAATFYDATLHDPDWYCEKLTAEQTGVFSAEALAKERAEYIREYGEQDGRSRFDQEYLCSFDAAVVGAYYAREFVAIDNDKRICSVPYDPSVPVHTAWDLGMDDSTAIWCAQVVGKEIRIIDYYEASGEGLPHYANWLRAKPYSYENHFLPHDVEVRELGSGKSRVEQLQTLGIRVTPGRPRQDEDRVNAVRMILPRCWFDASKTKRGVEALRNYKRDWDEKTKAFRTRPKHDWASHGADAFGELAFGLRTDKPKSWAQPSTKWVV